MWFILAILFFLFGGNTALAQTDPNIDANTGNGKAAGSSNVINNSGTFGKFEVGLPGNGPFSAGKDIGSFLDNSNDAPIRTLVNLVVTFVIGIIVLVAVITIVIAGYLYMTAAGNASQVASAKEMIYSSLIGIFIALISVVILNTINPYLGKDAKEPALGSPTPNSGGSSSSSKSDSIINSGGADSNASGASNISGSGSGSNGSASSGTGDNQNNGTGGSTSGSSDQNVNGADGTTSGSSGINGSGGGSGNVTDKPLYVRVTVDNGQYYVAGPTGANYKLATLDEVTALANGTATGGENGIRVKIFQTENGNNTNAISSLQNKLSQQGFTNNQILNK